MVKKKIKDITIQEASDICASHANESCKKCQLWRLICPGAESCFISRLPDCSDKEVEVLNEEKHYCKDCLLCQTGIFFGTMTLECSIDDKNVDVFGECHHDPSRFEPIEKKK